MIRRCGPAALAGVILLLAAHPPALTSVAQDVPQTTIDPADLDRLADILRKAKDYCARLSRASLDFVCLEEISEKTRDRRLHLPVPSGGWASFPIRRDEPEEHKYLYDYQFIVKDGQRTEKREMLERDGTKTKADHADLVTRSFFYRNVLFGAADLLAESRQSLYRYHLKGRELLDGERVLVIDAVPVPGLAVPINQGRIWIRERDAGVLRIVWNVRSMESHPVIQETAKEIKGRPEITQITEFQFEKNGIRFPSRFFVEEAYVDKKGKKFIKSVIDAVYRDYKFFTVEVDSAVLK